MEESAAFTIRDLETYDECLQVRQVQQAIWSFAEPDTGLYPPVLVTASKNGGVVLGAFDRQDDMLGYSFGFLGREPGGPLKLCSQTMGVLPAWRRRGVATSLKWAQRERALAAGLPLITWTFDPLEGANARLNLHKLGAVSRRYARNLYGERFGDLNQGLPSDRLLVEWWIGGRRVRETGDREIGDGAREGVPVFEVGGQGVSRRVMGFRADLDAPCLLLEVPLDIQQVKQSSMSLAMDWRLRVREAFETCLERGYLVADFLSEGRGENRRNYYRLSPVTDDLQDWIGME